MKITKKQHYVPQSYLKRFTLDGKSLYVFDKSSRKSFGPTSVTNVAHENYFYDIPKDADSGTAGASASPQPAEQALASLEGRFKKVIDVAIKFAKGGAATPEHRVEMALCAAVQLVRTRDFRDDLVESMESMGRATLNGVLKLASPELASQVQATFEYNENAAAALHAQFMWDPNFISRVAATLCNHIWVVGINQTSVPLCTSDSPVVMRAHKELAPFVPRPDSGPAFERAIDIVIESDRPGIESEGVEIVFPLSPDCVLIFLERTYFKELERRDGHRLVLGVPHVEELNRLQVLHCYRQVYCSSNDFMLAEETADEHPEACDPERGRVKLSKWEWRTILDAEKSG